MQLPEKYKENLDVPREVVYNYIPRHLTFYALINVIPRGTRAGIPREIDRVILPMQRAGICPANFAQPRAVWPKLIWIQNGRRQMERKVSSKFSIAFIEKPLSAIRVKFYPFWFYALLSSEFVRALNKLNIMIFAVLV
jgi:hypothetical protein